MKKFQGLNPSGVIKLCDHFAMVTWEFFGRMAAIGNLPYVYVLSEKNLNALWVPAIVIREEPASVTSVINEQVDTKKSNSVRFFFQCVSE